MSAPTLDPPSLGDREGDDELARQFAERLVSGMRRRSLIQLKFALAMMDEGATGTLMATVIDARQIEFIFVPESPGAEFHYGWESTSGHGKGQSKRPGK